MRSAPLASADPPVTGPASTKSTSASDAVSSLRLALLDALAGGRLTVRTDPLASPTGFPFKVAQLAGTLAEPAAYTSRERLCDLGYLRTPYVRPDGWEPPVRTPAR